MANYLQKSKEIEALTFDELVEYGKANGGNIVNGMPWSFRYHNFPVTHESDTRYIVGGLDFTPADMLLYLDNDHIRVCTKAEFQAKYRPAMSDLEIKAEAMRLVLSALSVKAELPDGKLVSILAETMEEVRKAAGQRAKQIKKGEGKDFPPTSCSDNRPVLWEYQLDTVEGSEIPTNSVTILSRPVIDIDWSGEHAGEFAVVTLTRAEVADILMTLEQDIAEMREHCPGEKFI